MSPRFSTLLAAALVLVMGGCTTAPKAPVPAPPAADLRPATIRGSEETSALLDNFTAFVRAVDGQRLTAGRAGWNQPVVLKPGPHRLEVAFMRGSFFAQAELTLDVRPGATYEVRQTNDAQVYGAQTYCEFLIVDLASGQKAGLPQRVALSKIPASQ
jgi:hypothetical protein